MSHDSLPQERRFPRSPLLGASAAIFREGRVLIARRARPPAAGMWSLPGGLVEPGETLAEAVAREVMEETGLDITIVGPADVVEIIEKDGGGAIALHFVVICHAARWLGGEAICGDGTDAAEWVTPESLVRYQLTRGAAAAIGRAASLLEAGGTALPDWRPAV